MEGGDRGLPRKCLVSFAPSTVLLSVLRRTAMVVIGNFGRFRFVPERATRLIPPSLLHPVYNTII